MAEGIATRSSRGHRTICVPIEEEDYLRIIHDPKAFRRTLDDCFRQTPELFPVNFALGYELKDDRMSAKQQIPIRRILLKDDSAYSIRPSFLMPYMTARTADVEGPLFLRKFGVPFWALARVFGGDPMSWYRMECGLGRFSVVGTTVRTATLPEHLLADEHHQGLDGQKVYIATTVGNGCCLGAEPAEAAGSDKLKVAYQVFKDEACDVSPKYAPKTVSTDGWKGTQAAWKMLFTKVVILLCFLHGWLKIRDRAKHLKEVVVQQVGHQQDLLLAGADQTDVSHIASPLVLHGPDPAPFFDHGTSLSVATRLGRTLGIGMEMGFQRPADQEVIPLLGQQRGLVEIAELAIGHPEPDARNPSAGTWNHLGHQADVIGLAVGVGGHRHGHPLCRQVGHQDLASDHLARFAPQRPESFGDILELLAIEDGDGDATERRGDRGDRIAPGQNFPKFLAGIFEEAQAQGDRDPPQFVIDRFLAGRQRALLFGSLEACSATPLVQNQSIANQLNKGGEFEDVLEATAPMLLEDLIEDGGFEQVRPQGQSRIGQGGPLKNHRTKKLPRQSKAGRQGFQKGLECRRQDGNRQLSHLRWLGRDRRAGPTIGITSPLRGRFRGSSRDGWDDHVATSMSLCDPIL